MDARSLRLGGRCAFSFSETGTLVYVPSAPVERRLFLVDLDGKDEALPAPPRPYEGARFSPDGQRLALTTDDGEVYLYELESDRSSLLTSRFEDASGTEWTPLGTVAWSPEGGRLALDAITPGRTGNLFLMDLDMREPPEPLLERSHLPFLAGWSPDGERVYYADYDLEQHPPTNFDIWEVSLDTGSAHAILESPRHQQQPVISSDGHWMAYHSAESGQFEVYVTRYRGSGARRQISIDGGQSPVWAPDGRRVYYRKADKMMVVEIVTDPEFSAESPSVLFEGPYDLDETWKPRIYDLSPDGSRFIMIQSEGDPPPPQVKLVQNWFEELKRLVPTK